MLKRKEDKNLYFTGKKSRIKKRRKKSFLKKQSEVNRLFQEQNQITWWKKLLYYFLMIGFVTLTIFLIYLVFFSNFFLLKDVSAANIGQTKTLSRENIKNNLNELIGQNILFIDLDDVVKTLMVKNPRLKTVEAEKLYPESLKVQYKEYDIVVHLYNPIVGRGYLVNEAGLVVQKGEMGDTPNLIYVEIESEQDFKTDEVAIVRDDLEYLQQIYTDFVNKIGLAVTKINYFPTRRELHLENEQGFQVWFDFKRPADDVFDDLVRVLNDTNIVETGFSVLDLRIKDKVFICHREGGCINYSEQEEGQE